MKVHKYGVSIQQGVEHPPGFVELIHEQEYSLFLTNGSNRRCEVYVEIDGKYVGAWILNSKDKINIEQSEYDTSKFIFLKRGTEEFKQASLDALSDSQLGLIKIIFTPEMKKPATYTPYSPSSPYGRAYGNSRPTFSYGAVSRNKAIRSRQARLTKKSTYGFQDATGLNLDVAHAVTIRLRLVSLNSSNHDYKELKSAKSNSKPRPLL